MAGIQSEILDAVKQRLLRFEIPARPGGENYQDNRATGSTAATCFQQQGFAELQCLLAGQFCWTMRTRWFRLLGLSTQAR
jgi:hypothetical protein